jgi:hypothetical protein
MILSKEQKNALYPGLTLAFMAIATVATTTFLGPFMPLFFYNIAQAIATACEVYLIGIGYGIFNDILGTGQNIDYFSKGHQYGFRAIESDDRAANSFAWGIVGTWLLSIIAAIPFGIAALICNFVALPAFSLFVPSMLVGAGIIVILADIYARVKKHNRLKNNTVETNFESIKWHLQPEQTENVKTLEQKAAWLSCNDRNFFGYMAMPIFGILGLIAYTVLRIVHVELPIIALSIPLQIGFLALPLVTLAAGTIYLFCHNMQREPSIGQEDSLNPPALNREKEPSSELSPEPRSQPAANKKAITTNISLPSLKRPLSASSLSTLSSQSNQGSEFKGKNKSSVLAKQSITTIPSRPHSSSNGSISSLPALKT